MVDFAFFRSRSFFGANVVAFIVSFAMFAMFFFLALYMQDVLRYSPLQAGVRFLPSTVMIMIVAPIAGRLADRIGPRPLMTGGLILVVVRAVLDDRDHDTFGIRVPERQLRGCWASGWVS